MGHFMDDDGSFQLVGTSPIIESDNIIHLFILYECFHVRYPSNDVTSNVKIYFTTNLHIHHDVKVRLL